MQPWIADRSPRIILRADGSATIGLGHVMRSLTLARALAAAGADVRFAGAGVPLETLSDLPTGLDVVSAGNVAGGRVDACAVIDAAPDLVIVDGYHFTAEFFAELETAEVSYAVIDDNAETEATSPVLVLNQNPHATENMYRCLGGKPELLLGLQYALIRPEVVELSALGLDREPSMIFVSFGGSDPAALSEMVAGSIASTGHAVLVGVGPAHHSRSSVVRRLKAIEGVAVVGPADYTRALATCGTAVLAAGSTLWEAACLHTPTIAVIVAANQEGLATSALRLGLVLDVLHSLDIKSDPTALQCLVASLTGASNSRSQSPPQIDGQGAARVSARVMRGRQSTSHAVGHTP